MRVNKLVTSFAAAAMILSPVAASAAIVQPATSQEAEDDSGFDTGAAVGIVAVLLGLVAAGASLQRNDRPNSP